MNKAPAQLPTTARATNPTTKGVLPVKHSRTYSVPETAQLIGVSKSALYEWVKTGKAKQLHPITIGNRTVFPRTIIDQLTQPEDAA